MWHHGIKLIIVVITYHEHHDGAICGAGSAYFTEAPEISPSFWWFKCCSVLCCVLWTVFCILFLLSWFIGVFNSTCEFWWPLWYILSLFDSRLIHLIHLRESKNKWKVNKICSSHPCQKRWKATDKICLNHIEPAGCCTNSKYEG